MMPLNISRSTPFRRLLSRIGSSTYRLNTVLVGLECVADGQGDGGAIAVTWAKPKDPDKARQVANQARIFACSSALVLAADVFDSFLREFASEEWLGFGAETRDIATKATTRPANQGGEYSVAERAEALCADLSIGEPISAAALDLLAKWRNVVAHTSDRSVRLKPERKQVLIDAASEIHQRYSHLDIQLALRNFEQRKVPVPKEVTTLIAIAVNFSRTLDEAAIRRVAPDEEKLCNVVERMLLFYFRESADRAVSPWRELADAWQGGRARRANILKKILAQMGVTESNSGITVPLPVFYLEELIDLDRDAFMQRFDIVRT